MPRGRKKKEVHPGQQCGPCHLCHQNSIHYSHLVTWEETIREKLNIDQTKCICRKCEKNIKRRAENGTYTIPQQLSRVMKPQHCIVQGCRSNQCVIHTSKFSTEKVAELLPVHPSQLSLLTTLCQSHYKEVYRHTHNQDSTSDRKKCLMCSTIIHGHLRHCPNPQLINMHYKEAGDMEIHITDMDYLCTACYNSHLDIVHQSEKSSSDDELQELLQKMDIPILQVGEHTKSIVEGVRCTLKKIGDILKQKTGILYSEVYKYFTTACLNNKSSMQKPTESDITDITKTLPKKYLFGYIVSFFGKHLVWECKQRSCGILMYRRGTDLALALSKTLKLLQDSSKSLEEPIQNDSIGSRHQEIKNIEQFCLELNNRIHNQINTITNMDSNEPYDIASFNVQKWIDCIDPVLWHMIVLLTSSVTERRKKVRPESISDQRKLQCLYTLCVLLFNTNRCCSIPLHLLLTDLVESQGGSAELIRMLNRVGAIASADTHHRYVQFIVEKKHMEGLLSELSEGKFTVVSIDNIDFLNRHALVFCGDQHRSWHGTTIQVVQPLCDDEQESDSPLPDSHSTISTQAAVQVVPLPQSHGSVVPSQTTVEREPVKRTSHPTPEPSPTTRSPAFKKITRRSRTRTEAKSSHHHIPNSPLATQLPCLQHPLQHLSHNQYTSLKTSHTIDSFNTTSTERDELKRFEVATFFYMILTSHTSTSTKDLPYLEFVERLFPVNVSPSKYTYLDVLDQNADSIETIGDVVSRLHTEFHIGQDLEHLVVAGDAKTYNHLQALKLDYGNDLSWLLPFPGDFHILMNFQPVLMKIYFDAGLKQVASASGHRGETLTSLQRCSHFKRTHSFLLQAWEGLYLHLANSFLTTNPDAAQVISNLQRQAEATGYLSTFESSLEQLEQIKDQFDSFTSSMADADPNWKFWQDFVNVNNLAYVALFVSVRSANWSLRLASLKLMAPIFCAFDRPTYGKLIPQHLADCLLLPDEIRSKFVSGGFTVSVSGRSWHSVGLDEAHEMLINRDAKAAVVHPSKEFVSRMALYFPFRSQVMHNFKEVIKSHHNRGFLDDLHSKTVTSAEKKIKQNIQTILAAVKESDLLPSQSSQGLTLRNSFTLVNATTAQQNDLLNFRKIGQSNLNKLLKTAYLGVRGDSKCTRQRLQTFSTLKYTKQLHNQLQKEKNLVTKCLKRRLLHCSLTGEKLRLDQYLELPRALADENGLPHKGQKSSTTAFFSSRYGDEVFLPAFPDGWIPDSVVLEGMFMINTTPLRIHSSMLEYARFLLQRHVNRYTTAGVQEVHIVFDDPGQFQYHPKDIERARRDSSKVTCDQHHTFSDTMKVPSKWNEMLGCRECKKRLVSYLGDALLQLAPELLHGQQKLIIGGAFRDEDRNKAWSTTTNSVEVQEDCYVCNSEEADTRVWLHVKHSKGRKKILFSPDTDVYHIGLTNVCLDSNEVLVVLSSIGRELKLLHLNKLVAAMESDLDLQSVPRAKIKEIIQFLYVLSGCDFTSFFFGVSKQAFLKEFYRYSSFITAPCRSIPGSLADTDPESDGFLAFVRLVGVTYFAKNRQAFPGESPLNYFDSFQEPTNDVQDQHNEWYKAIRATVWERIPFEDQLPPSLEALKLHWLRSLLVIDYWRQACQETITLLPMEWFGWNIDSSGKVQIEWDSPENLQQVRSNVTFLLRGCGCKTGCMTARCKCVKAGQSCGPGCSCSHGSECKNKAADQGTVVEACDSTNSDGEMVNEEREEDYEFEWMAEEELEHYTTDSIVLEDNDSQYSST